MDDLIEFLKARIEEDEARARYASPGPWYANAEFDEVLAVDGITVADGFALSGNQLRATIAHIARHDPARTLREVDAKRRTIEIFVRRYKASKPGMAEGAHFVMLINTLRLLAMPYADHPDYREEWRP